MRKVGRMAFELAGLPFHFRCHQMDDFGPAKNLMTMCFTYYHIGKAPGARAPWRANTETQGSPRCNVASSEAFPH